MEKTDKIFKTMRHLVVFVITILYLKYLFIPVVIWGFIEILILSIRTKTGRKIKEFICGLIVNVFDCVDILSNIVFQVPANRILLKDLHKHEFGNPREHFSKVLRLNFVFGNLKPRGIILYNIIKFFSDLLK
jgi:hypothetical protein